MSIFEVTKDACLVWAAKIPTIQTEIGMQLYLHEFRRFEGNGTEGADRDIGMGEQRL